MKYRVALIIILFLFSCTSDPLEMTPYGGVEFEQYIFQLNQDIFNTQNSYQNISTGESNLLFSGYIFDNLLHINDTSRVLITLDLSEFSDYAICSSIVSIEIPTISLYSSMDLSNIAADSLSVKLLSLDNYNEDDMIWNENDEYLIDIDNVTPQNLNYTIPDTSDNELIIELPDYLIEEGAEASSLICDNSITLLIEYSPDPLDSLQYIEWYSSDLEYGYSLTPKINLDYFKNELIDTTEYQFNILGYSTNTNQHGYYYISDSLHENWSTTYFMNIQDSSSGRLDSLIDFDDIILESPLIDNTIINQDIELAKLTIQLNSNVDVKDSISTILITLKDVVAYINSADPSGDDYDGVDTTLTQENLQYDIVYNSINEIIKQEKFNDFGVDTCKTPFEMGNGECDLECENNSTGCLYNIEGTENNKVLNWVDNDNNEIWSEGDSGEKWDDIGSDGCPDDYETGDPNDPCEDLLYPNSSDGDPNQDNYNPDPEGDDYNLDTDSGTEGNGELDWTDNNLNQKWDEGEGEQWLDYGLDGLPNTLDGFENNGIHEIDFEPYFDYGNDNIPSIYESGYCNDKNSCTEKNLRYDIGELKDKDDSGDDGCIDSYEDGAGGCCDIEGCFGDLEIDTDPNNDNYNIDPNNDNYAIDADLKSEDNGKLDWEDNNSDGIWDKGEGEKWFDYGLDQTENQYEQYLPENQIIVSLNTNGYDIDNYNESENISPEVGENGVALWISSINSIEDNKYEITLSIHSKKILDGIKFRLDHPNDESNLKISWFEEFPRHYVGQYSYVVEENQETKIFKDLSLYLLHSWEDDYKSVLPDSLIMLNYAYNIFCNIDSDSLKNFINNYSEGAISLQYSKIIIPIDTSFTDIKNSEFEVDLSTESDSLITNYLASSSYTQMPYKRIIKNSNRLEINIGNFLQYHINNNISFDGFILESNSILNNFNSLYLNKNNAYIHLVIQK